MNKKLTIVADKFSIKAVKMIGLAGGLAEKYKD
jgi:nucleoside phosphorylase